MFEVPTPHNQAKKGDFAKTVLMPGDPLRAAFIAENFLKDAVLVNGVRGVNGFTGMYKGKRVSVMASGMGMPSIAIYAHELFAGYGVECIIRVGSAGAIDDSVELRDIVLAQAACTDSAFLSSYGLPGVFAPIAHFQMLKRAEEAGKKLGANVKVGNVLSSDVFYSQNLPVWKKMGVLAVEMETAALYAKAAEFGKKALAVLTVSDCPLRGLSLSSADRQNTFTQMMEIALEIAEG